VRPRPARAATRRSCSSSIWIPFGRHAPLLRCPRKRDSTRTRACDVTIAQGRSTIQGSERSSPAHRNHLPGHRGDVVGTGDRGLKRSKRSQCCIRRRRIPFSIQGRQHQEAKTSRGKKIAFTPGDLRARCFRASRRPAQSTSPRFLAVRDTNSKERRFCSIIRLKMVTLHLHAAGAAVTARRGSGRRVHLWRLRRPTSIPTAHRRHEDYIKEKTCRDRISYRRR